MLGNVWWLLLTAFGSIVHPASAEIPADGKCKLYGFSPFSTTPNLGGSQFIGLSGNKETSVGFSQLSAFLLAAQHFNDRNPAVVPELAKLGNCSVTFDLNTSLMFDSTPFSHQSVRSLFLAPRDPEQKGSPPLCGMVGSFDDFSSPELAVMAQASEVPVVATRGSNLRVISDFFSSFSSSIHPDTVNSAEKLVDYLVWKKRDNYVAMLYDFSDTNTQRRESITIEFDEHNIKWMSSSFENINTNSKRSPQRSHFAAMQRVKRSGYKTVVICMSNPWESYQGIADAAAALDMLDGSYFFVWYDVFEPSIFQAGNENITKFTVGSAWIMPQELHFVNGETDPFLKSWRAQGPDLAKQVNKMNPKQPGEVGYLEADDEYFQRVYPEYGAAFMYDSVISIGIGACGAQTNVANEPISGRQHQYGVRTAKFRGATGQVEFGDASFLRGGTRRHGTAHWVAVNNLPAPKYYAFPDVINPDSSDNPVWQRVSPFYYADGSSEPPKLLRETPEQNYLSDALRVVGFSLMGIAVLSALISALFVFVCRKHALLDASRPTCLLAICFGCIVQSASIIPSSFDEGSGWSESQLSAGCMSKPWLLCSGYILVYSALFIKLWRVCSIVDFGKKTMNVGHIAWLIAVLMAAIVVLLVAWNSLDPLTWRREEINHSTGESMGSCKSDTTGAFVAPLLAVMLIPTVIICVLAHKARAYDTSSSYSEAFCIFIMTIVQIQIVLVGTPVVAVLKNESSDGRYFGLLLLQWCIPMSTLLLIMVPKMMAYHRTVFTNAKSFRKKRGQMLGVRVTGVSNRTGNHWATGTGTTTIPTSSLQSGSVLAAPSPKGAAAYTMTDSAHMESIVENPEEKKLNQEDSEQFLMTTSSVVRFAEEEKEPEEDVTENEHEVASEQSCSLSPVASDEATHTNECATTAEKDGGLSQETDADDSKPIADPEETSLFAEPHGIKEFPVLEQPAPSFESLPDEPRSAQQTTQSTHH